ncbi:FtsX-like permease family protein [Schumannella sp. 10F1B-5-1]|uniref:ABC transporter permease n=1 Tax=Schumannella sp. 10F1B-5-1 TaxID=2590780 RepID=UPI00113196BC|nr:FtsX-like permease family protein [Schumannella sp. 10F1B-5-1]TPW70793.1 FtsX-like permease family protein [Schumannella sp. 10F1B-5-1]
MSRLSGHGSSITVATLSAAFGVALLQVTGFLGALVSQDPAAGRSGSTLPLMLSILALVFIAISIYVGAIVTANTFSTIVAGRARTIALLRLIGDSAASQRRAIAREGLLVGIIGAALGVVIGTGFAIALDRVAVATDTIPDIDYSAGWLNPAVLIPLVAVVLTTWAASWIGSRRVLTVTPLQAIGGAQEAGREELVRRPARTVVAIVLFALGTGILLLGVAVGLVSPFGVLIGIFGGILSFSGLIAGAHLVMPPALRVVGRLFGSAPTARLAAENALRYPERSSRTTIGVVIGVTLITMFGVAIASFSDMIHAAQSASPEVYAGTDTVLTAIQAVFSVLVGFSALIAAVGLVNNLSLCVVQRTRELGLLRALGFSVRQLRTMITVESAQLTATAVLVGLVLGAFYGWCGAQSLLGSINGSPGIIVPDIPWVLLGVIVVAAAALTWVASLAPARRATRVAPVTALAVD